MATRVHRHSRRPRRVKRTLANVDRHWLLMLVLRTLASAGLTVLSHVLSTHGWHM